MYTVLLVGIGGFIGATLRYVLGGWIQNGFVSFPVGTLTINTIGSFFLGLIMYLSEYQGLFSDQTRIFLTIGILGAFTTLSTFGYESFRLLDDSKLMLMAINVVSTVLFSIMAVYLGKIVALSVSSYLLGGMK
ncbi:chromosome condensation protein CrcB [Methanosarcina spelaei]|uniref:Fluoride-specific ion channel FluC n=1 Tax=Methanosarcina spelaei TaxID=1036679 RepID=A0A2A2HV96_9EURY|nr:fluoride efflux transporter CrcB [Methanosarcina spelaei]PAV13238.1 chromosome condensation protein CrcB [Methanosarcina spelaei]